MNFSILDEGEEEQATITEQPVAPTRNALQLIEQLVEDCYQAEQNSSTQSTPPPPPPPVAVSTNESVASKTVDTPPTTNESQTKESTFRLVEMDRLLEINSPRPGEKRECINFDCKSNKKTVQFCKAPIWALNHFNVPRKVNRPQFVCMNCFDVSANDYERLCVALVNEQPLLLEKLPLRPEVVEILDSEEEDNGGSTTKYVDCTKSLSLDTLTLLEDHFEDVLKETFKRINIEQQTQWTKQILQVK